VGGVSNDFSEGTGTMDGWPSSVARGPSYFRNYIKGKMTLVTRDVADFVVAGIETLNPWSDD
jgi:hypothetical protein